MIKFGAGNSENMNVVDGLSKMSLSEKSTSLPLLGIGAKFHNHALPSVVKIYSELTSFAQSKPT